MTQQSTLACEVPACDSTYSSPEPRLTLKKLRIEAKAKGRWATLETPTGTIIDICPPCMVSIMELPDT